MESKTILIVDDEEMNIKLLKRMLKSENYNLFGALSGEEGLKMVADLSPDLILLDVLMPGIDGFEVCRRLKHDKKTRIIPVLMVTALKGKEHRLEAMETGADDLLSKPVDKTELVIRVKSLLRIKSYHDALRESEKRFKTLYRGIPVSTYTWQRVGEDFVLEDYNDAAITITKGKIKDFVGIKAKDMFNDMPEIQNEIVRCYTERRTIEREVQYRLKTTGEMKYLAVKYAFVAPDRVLEHTEDITEKKKLEAEAIRVGHLASLGELAAGIAHEINNPIHGVINYAQMLQYKCREQGEEDEIPAKIIKEGDRIATIVKNLLSFARDRKKEESPAHIKDILVDTLGLAEKQIVKDGIKISLDLSFELPMVKVRRQEIQQVFLNILSNALYALNRKFPGTHEDKTIEIRGEAADVEGKKHVRTTFFDRGTGISSDIFDKIRNPFFTTKPRGEGMGMGLSISHSIIKNHGGRLWFESVEGENTRVVVDIPVLSDKD